MNVSLLNNQSIDIMQHIAHIQLHSIVQLQHCFQCNIELHNESHFIFHTTLDTEFI